MRIARGREDGPSRAARETFTGEVWSDTVLARADGAMVLSVTFTPGARTHWHTHELGQVLIVTHGRGYVQTRGGDSIGIRAGDVVHFPPGEEHWHGAGPDTYLVHTAVSMGSTDWLDEVTDRHYRQATETSRS